MTFASLESGLSVHRNTEPNLHHTGGVKGITMGQCKKGKNETTKKNNIRKAQRGGGKWRECTGRNRTPESINVESFGERCLICLHLCCMLDGCFMLVSLRRPPCRCFFLCKNGLSHGAYIFGAKLKRHLVHNNKSSGISA